MSRAEEEVELKRDILKHLEMHPDHTAEVVRQHLEAKWRCHSRCDRIRLAIEALCMDGYLEKNHLDPVRAWRYLGKTMIQYWVFLKVGMKGGATLPQPPGGPGPFAAPAGDYLEQLMQKLRSSPPDKGFKDVEFVGVEKLLGFRFDMVLRLQAPGNHDVWEYVTRFVHTLPHVLRTHTTICLPPIPQVQPASPKVSREKVYEYLRKNPEAKVETISKEMGSSTGTVSNILSELRDHEIMKRYQVNRVKAAEFDLGSDYLRFWVFIRTNFSVIQAVQYLRSFQAQPPVPATAPVAGADEFARVFLSGNYQSEIQKMIKEKIGGSGSVKLLNVTNLLGFDYDFVLDLACQTPYEIDDLISAFLHRIPGVSNTHTVQLLGSPGSVRIATTIPVAVKGKAIPTPKAAAGSRRLM